jgi:hypothetical protein
VQTFLSAGSGDFAVPSIENPVPDISISATASRAIGYQISHSEKFDFRRSRKKRTIFKTRIRFFISAFSQLPPVQPLIKSLTVRNLINPSGSTTLPSPTAPKTAYIIWARRVVGRVPLTRRLPCSPVRRARGVRAPSGGTRPTGMPEISRHGSKTE